MHSSTHSSQSAPGSDLVDRYRDATSLPYGDLLIDLSPRTDDGLRYFKKTWSNASKFYITESLKYLKSLDDGHRKSLYSPSVSIALAQVQKSFPLVLSKHFIRFLCEWIVNFQSIKRHHVAKSQSEVPVLSLKRTTCKQRRDVLASEKGLQLMKVLNPPVISYLF